MVWNGGKNFLFFSRRKWNFGHWNWKSQTKNGNVTNINSPNRLEMRFGENLGWETGFTTLIVSLSSVPSQLSVLLTTATTNLNASLPIPLFISCIMQDQQEIKSAQQWTGHSDVDTKRFWRIVRPFWVRGSQHCCSCAQFAHHSGFCHAYCLLFHGFMNTWKTISLSLVTGSNKTFQREGWEGGRNSVQGVMKSKDLISRFWHEGISQEFIFAILRGKYEKKGVQFRDSSFLNFILFFKMSLPLTTVRKIF